MSGDMLVESFYAIINEKHCTVFFSGQPSERMKPYWTKGHWKIDNLCDNMVLNNKSIRTLCTSVMRVLEILKTSPRFERLYTST
jgi:hypothetical protein